MANRVAYDRVLLLDLYPGPNYPHVTVVSFHKTGIPVALLESAKLTRELRMAARDLPIYPDPGHEYYIVAKMEVKCDRTEEARAVRAVNEFVQELLRAGRDLHDLQEEIVDNFKGRVQHLIPYVRKDERDEQRTFKSSSRRREAISSSDPEGTPAAKAAKLGQIRKGTTSAANVAKKQVRVWCGENQRGNKYVAGSSQFTACRIASRKQRLSHAPLACPVLQLRPLSRNRRNVDTKTWPTNTPFSNRHLNTTRRNTLSSRPRAGTGQTRSVPRARPPLDRPRPTCLLPSRSACLRSSKNSKH